MGFVEKHDADEIRKYRIALAEYFSLQTNHHSPGSMYPEEPDEQVFADLYNFLANLPVK